MTYQIPMSDEQLAHLNEWIDSHATLRAENARLREEMKRANESAYENASAAHDEIKRLREAQRVVAAVGYAERQWASVRGQQQSDQIAALSAEILRLRSWLRALEYRNQESVTADLRGDDAPEGKT